MAAASWQCPDPQCGGVLDRHKRKRVAIDPHTDEEVGPWMDWGWVKFYWDPLSGVGGFLVFFFWIGVGSFLLTFFPGRASQSPLAIIISTLGLVVGVAVLIALDKISEKRRKAALARAVWYESYRCQRCRRWWLFQDGGEASAVDRGRITEEKNSV